MPVSSGGICRRLRARSAPGAETVRRQPHAGERDEAGRQPEGFFSDVLLPGIRINTGPNDFFPIEQMQLMKFNGVSWELFGDIIAGEVGH
jgi:hypothetical protein